MKTGDWLKLSLFALVGVVISLLILGYNSSKDSRQTYQYQQEFSNNRYPDMTGEYSNTSYPNQEYGNKKRTYSKNMRYGSNMQMQGSINGANQYYQSNLLPAQLSTITNQLIGNDLYLQSEIAAINQHGAKLHDEVEELKTQYGKLRQGLNRVYAGFQNQGSMNNMQGTSSLSNPGMNMGNGMQMMNTNMMGNGNGYANPIQTGMNGMGYQNPAQQQPAAMSVMGYNSPAQYQPVMGGMGNMNPVQNGMGSMNNTQNPSSMGMGMMDNNMMMMNMMNMMDKMMMMNSMQNSGGGMSSGGGGMGMM